VRGDVIHHVRRRDDAALETEFEQRLLTQLQPTKALPASSPIPIKGLHGR
jgi:hypothetical protein